jgi:hypothetical protein
MKSTAFALIASLGLLAAPAIAETNWSATGPKGGTAAGTTGCSYANGSANCNTSSTYTNPLGQEFKRESASSGNRFGGERVTTTTGPNGNTSTKTRSWKRN